MARTRSASRAAKATEDVSETRNVKTTKRLPKAKRDKIKKKTAWEKEKLEMQKQLQELQNEVKRLKRYKKTNSSSSETSEESQSGQSNVESQVNQVSQVNQNVPTPVNQSVPTPVNQSVLTQANQSVPSEGGLYQHPVNENPIVQTPLDALLELDEENQPPKKKSRVSVESFSTRNIKGKKIPELKSLTDVNAMKDYIHHVTNLGLQEMALTFLTRELLDKFITLGIDTPEGVVEYIREIIKKCEEADDVGTIEHWDKKIKFSMDYETPIEVRLTDLFMNLTVASKKIHKFETNVEVRRRFLTMIAKKLDPRLTITPEFMKNNPQINTIALFKKEVEKYKQLARKPPTESSTVKNVAQVSQDQAQLRRLEALVLRLSSQMDSFRRNQEEDDVNSKASIDSRAQDKKYTICSAKMRDQAFEGYSIQLETQAGDFVTVQGVLDSGAQTNCAIEEDFEKYCQKVLPLTNRVTLVPWQSDHRIEATKLGVLIGVKVKYRDSKGENRRYVFKNPVKVFLVPKANIATNICPELLLGSTTLKREGIHPLNSLREKDKKSDDRRRERKSSSRDRSKSRSRDRSRSRSKDNSRHRSNHGGDSRRRKNKGKRSGRSSRNSR